jgi:hypothetical protein
MNDQHLRTIFQARRKSDLASRPSFDAVLAADKTPRRLLPAFALAALTCLGLIFALVDRQPPVELADWQSPTDFLLFAQAPSVLIDVPSFNIESSEISKCESCF